MLGYRRLRRRLFVPATRSISVTEEGVTRTLTDDTVEAVRWNDLLCVRVVTTGAGPFQEDVFFVLDGRVGGCLVGQTEAPDGFLERLQALPGFDNRRLIEAMSSVRDAEFICWGTPPGRVA